MIDLQPFKLLLRMTRVGFGFIYAPDNKKTRQQLDHDDQIVPLDELDNNFCFRVQHTRAIFRFDEILDADRIRAGLEQLITKHGWSKVGARMQKVCFNHQQENPATKCFHQPKTDFFAVVIIQTNGRLEFRIPATFSNERPPLRYHHQTIEDSIHDQNIPAWPANIASEPVFLGNPSSLTNMFSNMDDTTDLESLITKQLPIFGLCTVQYRDATLLAMSWPHVLMDGVAASVLLNSLTMLLQNKEKYLPKVIDPTVQPLRDFGEGIAIQEYKLYHRILRTVSFLAQYVLFQCPWCFIRGTEQRTICIPRSFMQRLKEREVAKDSKEQTFVSDADLLCAWWTRVLSRHLAKSWYSSVAVYNLLALHPYLAKSHLNPAIAYVGNAVAYLPTLISSEEARLGSISSIATSIRRSIVELTEPKQLEAYVKIFRQWSNYVFPAVGKGLTYTVIFSNLTKLKFLHLDFSGALIGSQDKYLELDNIPGSDDTRKHCTPSLSHLVQDYAFSNLFTCLGQDRDGNLWLTGNASKRQWDAIQQSWNQGDFSND